MRITIIGAGNIGTQFAIEFASKGHEVVIFNSDATKIKKELEMVDETGKVIKKAAISMATSNICEAIKDSKYILITYPAFMLKDIENRMFEYVSEGIKIGVIPGTGGAEFFFRKYVEKGVEFFGLQRVPAVARLKQYGECVCVTGKRDRLFLASIPTDCGVEIANFLSEIFEIPCEVLPNYLSVTLTPSNPILHTTRLRTLFEDYLPNKIYERNPLFYEEWTEKSSDLLLKCDEELQKICKELNRLDLSGVRSLKLHYESNTAKELTKKIQSIKSFQGLLSPMIEVENGFVPNFQSRYFTADFPYGLSIIQQIADLVGVSVPNIKETLEWYYSVIGKKDEFSLSDYGFYKKEDIYKFYT